MPLILSEKDLAPLLGNPASMDSLRETIEEVLRAQQNNAITSQGGFSLPMADGKRNFRIVTASLPGAGEIMRINPQFKGAKDTLSAVDAKRADSFLRSIERFPHLREFGFLARRRSIEPYSQVK